MGRKKDLNETQITAVETLLKYTNHSTRQISAITRISKSSVQNSAKKVQVGSRRKGKCGAKRKTNERTDRQIVKFALEN
ncbi:hypothetical protein ILUMI_10451 [Ignelater luminosus]|uniref:Uncharacterized protein n=1 Tax=Ignelater luminosus TaxID=2038154 RepID=A0A8K0D2F0_IGNLU|nr:hypothetical protein ILUMI_10451 [Ignelater luminosus]